MHGFAHAPPVGDCTHRSVALHPPVSLFGLHASGIRNPNAFGVIVLVIVGVWRVFKRNA
jgi:hypothetical protein